MANNPSAVHPAHRGGQSYLGLFGVTHRPAVRVAPVAPSAPVAKPAVPAVRLSPAEQRMADRRACALATESRLARLQARLASTATRPERDALFDELPVRSTPAMQAAAYASDMREAFPAYHDDEEADAAHRAAGAEYVNAALSRES